MKKIALKPIGNIDPWILEGLSQSIGATFGKAVELNHAYNRKRNQYHSTAFLEAMSTAEDADDDILAQRAKKEAIHELGHTYGLGHCSDESCVMHFSNSLPETDRKRALFCKSCSRKLKKDGVIR